MPDYKKMVASMYSAAEKICSKVGKLPLDVLLSKPKCEKCEKYRECLAYSLISNAYQIERALESGKLSSPT